MKATVVDLRYRMKDILKALDRNEKITILYHGNVKGTILPAGGKKGQKVSSHPFFGMKNNSANSVEEEMDRLRGERNRDL